MGLGFFWVVEERSVTAVCGSESGDHRKNRGEIVHAAPDTRKAPTEDGLECAHRVHPVRTAGLLADVRSPKRPSLNLLPRSDFRRPGRVSLSGHADSPTLMIERPNIFRPA
ncbi:hypothetical protein B0G80_4229 [Paraburkholderia sp. BL6669N2]|nr:hypothetical protein B0G80_4229 [Paraburkholderia sp. BL6669N2]